MLIGEGLDSVKKCPSRTSRESTLTTRLSIRRTFINGESITG
jgi:hypothetical protein